MISAADAAATGTASDVGDRPDDRGRAGLAGLVNVRSTVTAVQFDPLLPFDTWKELGIKIGRVANSSRWWLGDWLLFGRYKYGTRYRAAIEATGLDYQTLRNYAVVARRFEPSRRRATLSFQHHAELCALDDETQDRWLDEATDGGWSRIELRRRVRGEALALDSPRPEFTSLELSGHRAERWRLAARRSTVSLEVWIQETLDRAADAILGGDG